MAECNSVEEEDAAAAIQDDKGEATWETSYEGESSVWSAGVWSKSAAQL
jgi:hypothetical protein